MPRILVWLLVAVVIFLLVFGLTKMEESRPRRILAAIGLLISLPLFIFFLFGFLISFSLGLEDVGLVGLIPMLILWTVLLGVTGYAAYKSARMLFSP